MNQKQLEIFNKLWKVKLLKELLKNKSELRADVTRSEKSSIERDIGMICYGFTEAIRQLKELDKSSDLNTNRLEETE